MKNKLFYSPEALNDLDGIWDYIAMELQNPEAAQNTVNKILEMNDKLMEYAEMGAPLSSVADVGIDYRIVLSGNYMTFYRAEGTNISIDRILYGGRDYMRILFPDQD